MQLLKVVLTSAARIGADPGDDDDIQLRKSFTKKYMTAFEGNILFTATNTAGGGLAVT